MLHRSQNFLFFWPFGGGANPSHARESWLAHASHLPNIPYLSCLLVLVPCLLLEAPSCSSLVGLSGPQDHFGCKWLPWGSPVRAPLATPVALPRAFMRISIPRTRVQLCDVRTPTLLQRRLADVPGELIKAIKSIEEKPPSLLRLRLSKRPL